MSIIKAHQGGYSVGSGAHSIINPKIKTDLNEYGEYQAFFDDEGDLSIAAAVCSMTDGHRTESSIAKELYSSINGIQFDETIGYYKNLYAGYVVEDDYRENGSSGGFTSWMLVELFREKLIDGVIHVKKSCQENLLFEYSISRNVEEIKSGAKSRYYPAEYSRVISQIGISNEKFAVVGIPSLIMELRLTLEAIPSLKKRIVYMVGLVCGHQKSTKYAECLAWECGIKPGCLKYIDFRKKLPGEPANLYVTEMTGVIDGKIVTFCKKQNESFISNWGHGFFKKKFSDYTDDIFNETSDICMGDAWLPAYVKDSKGTNIIITRNDKIDKIIESAMQSGRVCLEKISKEEIIKSQSGLIRHARDEIGYRLEKLDRKVKWRPSTRVSASANISFLRKRIQDAREKIATLSHIRYREAVGNNSFSYFKKSMRLYVMAYQALYSIAYVLDNGMLFAVKKLMRKSLNFMRKVK